MKKSVLIITILFIKINLFAQNPIVPPGVYIADPTARIWADGKLYIYGSRDESTEYYCSWKYHVLSTDDLLNWTIHEDRFFAKGEKDEVPYSDALLFAPDCQYRDGTYYLYYCQPDPEQAEGVATSKNPTGPFVNGEAIDLGGYNQIDPAVFIDDDGQAYYTWGQFKAKIARLKPNMKEIDVSTIVDDAVTEDEHYFHEGGFMIKRNDIYYYIYAHMGRAGRPTAIGYATSDSPMGPYQYGGVIIDNDHSDPAVWNNHGSIIEYEGQWYVFYHRSTHNSKMMRKACVEPIYFNDDGSINEVEMTTQGAGPPLDARSKVDAERACLLYGNVRIQAFADDNEELAEMRNDDKVAYKYIDFGEGVNSVEIRVAPGSNGGTINIGLENSWGRSIGTINVPGNGDGKTWQTIEAEIENTGGVHAVWLRFYGEGDDMFKVDWFRFR